MNSDNRPLARSPARPHPLVSSDVEIAGLIYLPYTMHALSSTVMYDPYRIHFSQSRYIIHHS